MRGLLIAIALLGAGAPALAGVNLRNGNYFTGFTDLAFEGAQGRFELDRYYNSKSTHKGLFGLGWGSWVETRVWVRNDGTVRLEINGNGSAATFRPLQPGQLAFEVGLQALAERWLEDTPGRTATAASAQIVKLRSSQGHRIRVGRAVNRRARVRVGQRFTNRRRGQQVLIRTATGWTLEQPRWTDRFDQEGHLIKRQWPELTVRLKWDDRGRLVRLEDDRGRWMRLTYEGKRVASARASNGKRVLYRYDRRGFLVWSRDGADNTYWFTYDRNANLVRIGYQDQPSRRNSYVQSSGYLRGTASREDALWYRYGKAKGQEWTEVWQGPDSTDPTRPHAVRIAYQTARDRRGYQSPRGFELSLMCTGSIRRPKLHRYCGGYLSKGRYRWHNHAPDGREVHWIEDCAGTRPAPKK